MEKNRVKNNGICTIDGTHHHQRSFGFVQYQSGSPYLRLGYRSQTDSQSYAGSYRTQFVYYMDNVRAKINVHYRDLSVRTDNVIAIMVRDAFHGNDTRSNILLSLFDRHNADYGTLVGKQTTAGTFGKYVNTRNRLGQHIRLEKHG